MRLRSFSWVVVCCLAWSGCASKPEAPAEPAPVIVAIPSVAASAEPAPPADIASDAQPSPESGHAMASLLGDGSQDLGEAFGSRGSGASGGADASGGVSSRAPQINTKPVASASLDHETIRAGVRAGMASIKGCYEQHLKSNPTLRGRAMMRFVIDPSGAVAKASVVESTLASPELERCLERAVMQLQFPPRTGGPAIVNYPFIFEPGS